VARTTVAKILKTAGMAPAPERPTSWRTLLKAHADTIAAADFFSVEVWTGLVTHYVLFAIDLATKAVHIAGVTPNPDGAFMAQVDGFLRGKKKFIVDRDTKFTEAVRKTLAAAGVEIVLTAVRAPNTNAIAERFVKTIKDECLSRMVFFGEGMLRWAIAEFAEHYHTERNHQSLGNRLLRPGPTLPVTEGTVHRHVRLGGLLSFYHRSKRRAAS